VNYDKMKETYAHIFIFEVLRMLDHLNATATGTGGMMLQSVLKKPRFFKKKFLGF